MKLKKMIISNFRCFKDKQIVDFDLDGKITLFYGLSGHGKSTILQFINWMFYDIYPRKKDTRGRIIHESHMNDVTDPLYNKVLFREKMNGSTFNVEGSIEFEHQGREYELIKCTTFEKSIVSCSELSKSIQLNYKEDNGSWVQYQDKVDKKIEEIVPKALSKYFFFSGEDNIIEESNAELKTAIYNLFGLTKYSLALNDIGNKTTKNTLLYKYEQERINNKPKDIKGTASELFKNLTKYSNGVDYYSKYYQASVDTIAKYDGEITKLVQKLAVIKNPKDYKKRINELEKNIELYKSQIKNIKIEIGNELYKFVPYLVLSHQIKTTRDILSESARNEKTYKDLMKSTLEDILKQGVCVCGCELDSSHRNHIQNIINSMPPHSFNYTFNQFVSEVENMSNIANYSFNLMNDKLVKISSLKSDIDDADSEYKQILEEMKKSNDDQAKEIADQLQALRSKKKGEEGVRDGYMVKLTQCRNLTNKYRKEYTEAMNYENSKVTFDVKIDILNNVKQMLEGKLEKLKKETATELNKSIIDVYNQISTQSKDYSNLNFLNDDFTLRDEYKSGGQKVVDIFSYIIGMIKAITIAGDDSDNNEFPVIIDAPFSHTDHLQMAHVVDVIPTIVSQTTMFTFDVIRIKESCNLDQFGKVWFIESDASKEVSVIKKGTL